MMRRQVNGTQRQWRVPLLRIFQALEARCLGLSDGSVARHAFGERHGPPKPLAEKRTGFRAAVD
jgi:hypothetical protein